MENYKLLSEYINGNYKVRLFSDGTKTRFQTMMSSILNFLKVLILKLPIDVI